MDLTTNKLKQLADPSLTEDERALLRCRYAADFIHSGQFEAARETLGHLWRDVGERPNLQGLSLATAAEVLLQCGTLSGCLGSVQQIDGAQEKAKDLLTEALRMFENLGQTVKASEVKYELGRCYWRMGAYDEARIVVSEAIESLGKDNLELKARALIRRTLMEISTNRYVEALSILKEAEADFEFAGDAIKGRWHGQKGLVYGRLASLERNPDYYDRAIIEFTAAIYHYEQAKHERYCATNQNNLAMLLNKLGRYAEAHEHLDRAIEVLERLRDVGTLAQVNETRARVLISEERYTEAQHVIANVVETFERGSDYALLADALTVQGVVWARRGVYEASIFTLRRALKTASEAGASSNAAMAALTLIEEHGAMRLSAMECYNLFRQADELLRDSQDPDDTDRLIACARIVIPKLIGPQLSDKQFSLSKVVKDYEARFIEQALELEQGSVTRAAKRLGVKHQTLAYIIRARHKRLLSKRTPAVPRKRSIITKRG